MGKFRAGVGPIVGFLLATLFLRPILAEGFLERGFVEPLIDSPAKTMGSDFNGDGIADIGIAARGNDDGGSAAGAVYILYGAGGLSQTYQLNGAGVNVTLVGSAVDDQFAYMGGGGDVNSDGFDDLVVGADQNDNAASNAGAVYIIYGSPNLAATINIAAVGADVTIVGKAASDFLGRVTGGVGDFNGDGFDDVAASAPGNDDGPGANNAGAAYILFGGASLSSQIPLNGVGVNVTVLGKAASDSIGAGGSNSAGDVNSDGFDDLLMGTSGNDDGGIDAGAAYILFGSSSPSATYQIAGAGVTLTVLGKNASDFLGIAASGVGDVNGDGFHDVLMGAYGNADFASTAGAAYIIYGRSGLSGTLDMESSQEDVKILGDATTDQLGRFQASGAGDVNDDGFFDVMVGSRYNDDGAGANAGAQYVVFGGSSLAASIPAGNSDITILGKVANDQLGRGRGFSGLGDINNDGFADFMAAGMYNDDTALNAGAIYIVFGSGSISSTISLNSVGADVTILGKAASDFLGLSLGGGRSFHGP